MARLASLAAQIAVRTLLRSDAALEALTGDDGDGGARVFDGVPDDQAYPYVTFGDHNESPWDVFGKDGSENRLTLFVWSQALGYEEALTIADRIQQLLHNASLAFDVSDERASVRCRLEMLDTMREPDGRTRRAVMRFLINTEETT
ncbi:MAG TPA: DUF3168 domain-containing protein [Agromyces sp.]